MRVRVYYQNIRRHKHCEKDFAYHRNTDAADGGGSAVSY